MRTRLLVAFALLLAGCAPRLAGPAPVILVPGGRIVGAWAELDGGFPLPAPPRLADRAGDRLYLAYPYELDVFQAGEPVASYDLPGEPRFLHARPEPVVGTTEGVFSPQGGFFPYPANDARRQAGTIYWTDGHAHRDEERLFPGTYWQVVADRPRVAFLGKEAWFLDGTRFPLPPFRKAELLENLYLLTEEGILALSPSGLELARVEGRFLDLAVDPSGVYVLLANRQVRVFSKALEALP